ncbi:MAG: T9SS type A sorting domain-containing protein, partial [bacterium]
YIANNANALATGGDFEYGSSIVKTSNSGLNWIYDTLGSFGVATGVDFRTSYEGWITLGIAQKFSYTLDAGNTWVDIFSPDSIPVFGIDFADSLTGWAVGYYGAIFKYNTGIVNIINNKTAIDPSAFKLLQNYPNPFNPETVISYFLNNSDHVNLKIYDALGKYIMTIVNADQGIGDYHVTFIGNNLPSGIYFYELTTGKYSEVKKMLLLK